jgi:hypothetical protein
MKTFHVLACTGLLSAGLALSGCAAPNAAPGAGGAAADGWRPLFNGTDTSGWTMFLPDPKADPAKTWSVKDGVLRCEGKPVGYIRTNEQFTSFELELDWRFDPARGPGNSGVLLRVQAPDKVWPKSVEAQLQSQSAGDIWNIDAFTMMVDMARTDGRHTEKANPTNEKPLGGWNHYRIVLDGGKLELWVNGLLQNTAIDVQAIPGTIALQSEGAYIEFRDIRIRPLPAK